MNQAAPQLRVPESMGPKELGSYMRGLREHFKLSPQDVSERLHIRMRYVTAIEEANYDAMPGKIYARGYVQTYAEFLGLDAEQVVKQCFPAEEVKTAPISIATPKPEIKPAAVYAKTQSSPLPQYGRKGFGKNLLPLAIVIGLAFAAYALFSGNESVAPEEESAVAEVPETLLASVRSVVMPTAQNYDCLMHDTVMGCYFAQSSLKTLSILQYEDIKQFEEEIADAQANPPAAKEPEADTSSSDAND